MSFYKTVLVTVTTLGCLVAAGCAVDTPKSILQNQDEYAGRVFVPSALPKSVQATLAQSNEKPLRFTRITFTRETKVETLNSPVVLNWSSNATYQNVGNGLVRVTDTQFNNGIQTNMSFSLTYRGFIFLLTQDLGPTDTRLRFMRAIDSFSNFDVDFDKTVLNAAYEDSWSQVGSRSEDRRAACTAAKTYPASKLNSAMKGSVKEFDCKYYNRYNVVDTDTMYAYLDAYGVVVPTHSTNNKVDLNWKYISFKAE